MESFISPVYTGPNTSRGFVGSTPYSRSKLGPHQTANDNDYTTSTMESRVMPRKPELSILWRD